MENKKRVICWFSCGATSAIATKLAINKYKDTHDLHICYTDPGAEHPDNRRFLKDCESWFCVNVKILKSDKYKDIWEVYEKTRYLVGVGGARCTTEMKKLVRRKYQKDGDIQVFGFDASEQSRANRFRDNNPEVCLETPLIDAMLTKSDCLALLENQGIEIPYTYKLGFKNANCIPCVKGQAGYWNKIRQHFPKQFSRMAKLERDLDVAINKKYVNGKRVRVFLDELPEDMGRFDDEPDIECSLLCLGIDENL